MPGIGQMMSGRGPVVIDGSTRFPRAQPSGLACPRSVSVASIRRSTKLGATHDEGERAVHCHPRRTSPRCLGAPDPWRPTRCFIHRGFRVRVCGNRLCERGHWMTTLQNVLGEKDWDSKYGRMVSVKLDFGDFQAELNTKHETLSSRLEMCETWIGKESSEWAFEDRGTWDSGNPKPKKVLSWPGKVAYSGAQEPHRAPNTRSMDRGAEQPSILASVALKAAVEAVGQVGADFTATDILQVASVFNDWLTNKASGSASAQTHTADPSFRADPDPPSAAQAPSGPTAGPSTSTA